MKLVECMGCIYRLSDKNYRKLYVAIANEEAWDLDKLGTCLGIVDSRITNITPKEAKEALDAKIFS